MFKHKNITNNKKIPLSLHNIPPEANSRASPAAISLRKIRDIIFQNKNR
jgi:hypothetical protein